jgi:hypothetical protein
LLDSSVAQNDGVDNLTTLDTAIRGNLWLTDAEQYIHAEVSDHESAASIAR